MNILILGATGFIGNSIFLSLVSQHDVLVASRKPIEGYNKWKHIDFLKENNWSTLLENIDLVINCIGIIEGDFNAVQTTSPISMYKHCISKGISIIHISAIGAEVENPISEFLQSKKKTDDFLLKYKNSKVIYPGIVLGNNGKSAQFFSEISHLPIIPLIKTDNIPFIHINQLIELIQGIILDFNKYPSQVFAFSKKESLKNVLESIKGKKVVTVGIPNFVFKGFFKLFPKMSIGVFNKSTFELSQQNLTKNHKAIFPEASSIIEPNSIKSGTTFIHLFALLSVSFVWIWSGVSSLISWDTSLNLMGEIGANNQLASLSIYAGSFIDIILGITVLYKKLRAPSVLFQIILMIVYMALLSVFAPHYWLHPFGVLSKNIPLIVLGCYLLKSK